jgi:hypothetical protein
MATTKQRQAAQRNIRKAAVAAKRKRTIAHLPTATRRDLSRNAVAARRRGGTPGRSLDDRTRQQLYDEAKKRNVPGRSGMGKAELIRALRRG